MKNMNGSVLDNLPLGTLISLASIVIVVIACIRNDLTIEQGLVALGATNAGAGVIGIARNGAGKGLRK